MLSLQKLVFLAMAALVVAQDSTSAEVTDAPSETTSAPGGDPTAGISECILTCSTTAEGCELTDVSCVCTNTDYQDAVAECITTTCPDELEAAMAVQEAQCAAVTATETDAEATASGEDTATATATDAEGSSTAPASASETASGTDSAAEGSETEDESDDTNAGIRIEGMGALGMVVLGVATGMGMLA